jgi:hypothetical protein
MEQCFIACRWWHVDNDSWASISILEYTGKSLFPGPERVARVNLGQLWHLIVLQGIMVGVGAGLLAYPVQTIAPEYFESHQAFCMGLVTAGKIQLKYLGVEDELRLICSSRLGSRWVVLRSYPRAVEQPSRSAMDAPRARLHEPSVWDCHHRVCATSSEDCRQT